MKDDKERAKLEGILVRLRDAIAAGHITEAVTLTMAVSDLREQATSVELVDLLERACVYGPKLLVDFMYDVLAPFAYEGWALALSLRVAKEDIARDLLERGVDLLQDVGRLELYRAIAAHETSFSRFDLTRNSPNLFLNPRDKTVSTEVFAPFTGREQLVGGSFGTTTSLRATTELVGTLAEEGRFEAIVFDDLFRAAVVRAAEAYENPDKHSPDTAKLCLNLAAKMIRLHDEKGYGSEYIDLILGNFIRADEDPRIMTFICKNSPSTFLEAVVSFPWLRDRPHLVEYMVPYLSRGTEEQDASIVELLAKNGKLNALKRMSELPGWDGVFTPGVLKRGIDAASSAGHAEIATWLLSRLEEADGRSDDKGRRNDLSDLLF